MKIQSGVDHQNSDDFDWDLHKGYGKRTFKVNVKFKEAFEVPPEVCISLTAFDLQEGDNARLEVAVSKIEFNQFTLEYKTWGSTKLHRATVNWLAHGK